MQDKASTGFEGYFKIECLKNGEVIDSYEDKNTIMYSARRSMAEIFANHDNNKIQFANRFVLGTEGAYITEYIPKTEALGFTKDKTTQNLYSEDGYTEINDGVVNIKKFSVVKYRTKYYRYIAETDDVDVTEYNILDTTKFIETSKPYTYEILFSLTKSGSYTAGTDSNNLAIGQSIVNRCKAFIGLPKDDKENILDQSIVEFKFSIPKDQANGQHTPLDTGYSSNISLFTEAGLYVNGRIFSMKTFPAKIKDDTTEVVVTWRIIF